MLCKGWTALKVSLFCTMAGEVLTSAVPLLVQRGTGSPLCVKPQDGRVHLHGPEGIALGLLCKVDDAAVVIDLHQPKGLRVLLVRGQGRHCDVCPRLAVLQHKVLVVHPVQVVTCRQCSLFLAGLPML